MVNIDLDEVEQRWPRFHAATVELGYRSTHALPLRLRGQVLGVLNLFCADRATLGDADVDLGQALCDIAIVGLLQERAVREGQVLAEQLQAALNSRILLEQAKGALSERVRISVDEAFTLMREYARRNRQALTSVAASVVEGNIPAALQPPTE
jgi:GAF domain-containing protein